MVVAFNPSIQEAEAADLCEANLVYRASSRTGKPAQRNPVLKTKTKTTTRKESQSSYFMTRHLMRMLKHVSETYGSGSGTSTSSIVVKREKIVKKKARVSRVAGYHFLP